MLSSARIDRSAIAHRYHEAATMELHVFADASPQAYGTVIYLVTIQSPGSVPSKFLASKSKVVPVKAVTLPCLELLACLLGARFSNYVQGMKPYQDCRAHFWMDSEIALKWISGEPNRWQPFIRNRVREIQELTRNHKWHHYRSKENPADLLTRGITASHLLDDNTWWKGPPWLSEEPLGRTTKSPLTLPRHCISDVLLEVASLPVVACPTIVHPPEPLLPLCSYSRLPRFAYHRMDNSLCK